MQNELITEASNLFPTIDHWQSFLELYSITDSIRDTWFKDATTRIRRHFMENLNSDWGFEPCGAPHRDTRWFLREFGPESLSVNFIYHYRLDLRVWNAEHKFIPCVVSEALKTNDFSSVHMAFSRIDRQGEWGSELIEERNYVFQSALSAQLTERELAWFVAHETESFVNQSVEKVERFTNSVEVTESIRQLNLMAQTAAEQHAQ